MYLLLGIIIAFSSVFILTLIGALFTKENLTRTLVIAGICTGIYAVIIWLISWGARTDIYGPTPLFGWVIFGAIIAAIVGGASEEEPVAAIPGAIIAVIGVIWLIVVAISGSDMNRSTDKGRLLQVEIKKVDQKVLKLADPEHICLVNEPMAKLKAEKALASFKLSDGGNAGSRYKLDKGTKQYVDGQLWWIFPLEFNGHFQWKRFPTSPGYVRVSCENPTEEAQAVQHNRHGKPIIMKYLNTASWNILAERYLRKNGYLRNKIEDWTFEVDDDWNPYYTASDIEWTIKYGGDKVKGVVVLNVQTGEVSYCKIDEVTEKYPWIDRAIPIDVIDYQTKKWGLYAKAEWAFTKKLDGLRQQPTEGWYLTYDEGKCYLFTGWTSLSKSVDLIGVSLTDCQTGKTFYYPTQGSTEEQAKSIAKGHWNNFPGYEIDELVPYNIYGMLTYVIPISFENQFKGVSLVSAVNKDINAKGETLEAALSAYRASMSSANLSREIPYEGQPKSLTITAKIAEVGMPFVQGQTQIYPFTLQGVNKIFQINYTSQNAKASFLKPDREVVIIYMDTKEKVITCQSFDIPDIKLTDQNPSQARWVQNQKEVKKEQERVNNIQENQELIETEDLGKINPDSLKKFIKQQQKK